MKPLNITINRNIDGEYRVPHPNGKEATAYYTDDKNDAIGTAKAMWGQNITIKFKRVIEHNEMMRNSNS